MPTERSELSTFNGFNQRDWIERIIFETFPEQKVHIFQQEVYRIVQEWLIGKNLRHIRVHDECGEDDVMFEAKNPQNGKRRYVRVIFIKDFAYVAVKKEELFKSH